MTKFIIRDDICDPETFFELRVFYDSLVRTIYNAGGYAFVTQIEALWAGGNKNFISRMVEVKIVKLEEYNNQQKFIYLTEASLKYIKYADSPQNYDGIAKNLFSVDTLSPKPSPKQLFSSALKFTQLAQRSVSHSVPVIGKLEYSQYVEDVITQYGRRLFPDFETDIPIVQDVIEWCGNNEGYKKVGVRNITSHYKQYLLKIPPIKKSLKAIFDSMKCVLLPKFEEIPIVDSDLLKVTVEFIVFDVGVEKVIRDYVVTAFKLMQTMDLGIKEQVVKFIVYTYSEERKQLILNNFNKWFKKPENITLLKEERGWQYTQIEFELELNNFHVDLIVGKIMKAKRISPKKRQIAKTPENLNRKAKESIGLINEPSKLAELAEFHDRMRLKALKKKRVEILE